MLGELIKFLESAAPFKLAWDDSVMRGTLLAAPGLVVLL